MQTFRPLSPRRRFLVTTLLLSITLFNVVPLRLTAQKPESPVGENSSQITSGSDREPSRPTLAELIAGLRAVEQSVRCLSAEYAVESRKFFTKPGEPLPENVLIQDHAVASFGRSQVMFLATADGRYRTAISTLSTHQRFDRSQVHRTHVRTAAFDGQKTRCIEMQIAVDGSVRKSGRTTDRKTWYSPHPFDFTINHIGAPISEVLTSRGGNVVDRVAWEKTTVYVVETPSFTLDNGYTSKRRYWIDPTRDFVVVRRQILQPQNDGKQWAIHHQIDCKEHKEIRPGVWLPMQVETINNVVSDRASHLVAKNTISVSVWRVNDTPNADHFSLEIDVQTGPLQAE